MNKQKLLAILGIFAILLGSGIAYKYYQDTMAGSEKDEVLQAKAADIEKAWEDDKINDAEEEPEPQEPTSYKEGETIGVIKIPAFGKKWKTPILEGTSDDTLEEGVGRYDTSSLPGKLGNFALAGHRSGDPQPFRKLLELEEGDEIIIETEIAIYTYIVTKPATETTLVAKDGGWVLHSPEVEGFEDKSVITLTTCTHLYRSDDRSVLFGELEKRELKE